MPQKKHRPEEIVAKLRLDLHRFSSCFAPRRTAITLCLGVDLDDALKLSEKIDFGQ